MAVEGPVERRFGRLVFCIPMAAGGAQFKQVSQHTSYEDAGDLVVVLPDWLATQMRLREGSTVHVDDRWGKLNFARLN